MRAGATINLVNQCTEAIVSCAQAGSGTINCYPLAAGGGSQTLDVASSWQAGVIWAYPGTDTSVANTAKPQANLAEFTIGGSGGKDYYDLSNVVSLERQPPLNHLYPAICEGIHTSISHDLPVVSTCLTLHSWTLRCF